MSSRVAISDSTASATSEMGAGSGDRISLRQLRIEVFKTGYGVNCAPIGFLEK